MSYSLALPRLRNGLVLALTGAAISPPTVHALGVRVPDQDPFAIARGNAFVATADNPSAIYYNPAGITQLTGHNISLGANIISISDEFTPPTGAGFDTESKVHVLPQLFYTFNPESMPVSFGLGFYTPFGLGVEWPDQTPFRTLALDGEITFGTINPVAAWKINEQVSVAGGLMINYGDTTLSRGLLPPEEPPYPPGNNLEFNGDAWSVGFNLGVRWEITEQHSVGATYRSASKMNFSGTSVYSPMVAPTGPASAEFQFPQNATVGYSFRPTPKWNLEINVDWTDWDSLNTVTLQQPETTDNVSLLFNWRSSWMFQFGGTRYLENGWNVSAGYIFSQNSVPDEWFNPAIPDSDRHVFSVGVGKKFEKWSLDAAFQYGYGPTRTLANSVGASNEAANGDYVFNSFGLALSAGYRF